MASTPSFHGSRPFDFRLALGLPLLLMGLMLLFDTTPLDFQLEYLFYDSNTGFVGRNSYWLENILHDRVKQTVIALAVLLLVAFLASWFYAPLRQWRRPLGYVVLALSLTTSVVMPLKIMTGVHCPWSLSEFGGSETYTPLLSHRAETLKPGLCWPGGHASTGFSLLALFFALRDRRPKAARVALVMALGLGAVLSLGRMAQGAHFLSHNVWTLLIDWMICALCYRWLVYRPGLEQVSVRGGRQAVRIGG
ncbi:phosphatase PAP2 family protein [Pseudomonas sp.]|uniref:phosphatase PAP2 family protein n=1 Tax=Pseudomonas sp. TaxID=306 RepID=UPI0028A914E6|nr:phosphatase PAP2 family protein [Pseudomonas sp.]